MIFIDKLNEKLLLCKKCKNHNTKGGPYLKNGMPLDLIFVAQNPGKSNYNKDLLPHQIVPFGLDKKTSYNRFFYLLCDKYYSLTKKELNFYITNIVKCATIDNTVTEEQINNCSLFLDFELKYFRAKKIVALGKLSAQALYNFSIEAISLQHPGYMNRNNTVEEQVNKLIKELL